MASSSSLRALPRHTFRQACAWVWLLLLFTSIETSPTQQHSPAQQGTGAPLFGAVRNTHRFGLEKESSRHGVLATTLGPSLFAAAQEISAPVSSGPNWSETTGDEGNETHYVDVGECVHVCDGNL